MRQSQLIAPCGINCAVCAAHLRTRNVCPGCRANGADKPVTRIQRKMKASGKARGNDAKFCCQCEEIPCDRLALQDKRYRTRYRMSPIEELQRLKEAGVRRFLAEKRKRC